MFVFVPLAAVVLDVCSCEESASVEINSAAFCEDSSARVTLPKRPPSVASLLALDFGAPKRPSVPKPFEDVAGLNPKSLSCGVAMSDDTALVPFGDGASLSLGLGVAAD